MADREVIKRPTVADIIAYLSKFPPDMPFRIEDPDTYWMIEIIHAFEKDDCVWFTGEYEEMVTT